MRKLSVLIVEDEAALLRGIRDNFAFEGYETLTARTGEQGYEIARAEQPDLVILDVMLPRKNGFEVCRQLRDEGFESPIIMLTAKDQEQDIVQGLNLGADDYVTKPFSIKELLARSKAFLRRKQREMPDVRVFEGFTLDLKDRKLSRSGEDVALTPKEFGVLELLSRRPGRVVTRETLLDAVWGYTAAVSSGSLERCVSTLRSKIELNPQNPNLITTVREVGYRFQVTDEAS
jgi:DNA-binding response OmpR family regulator